MRVDRYMYIIIEVLTRINHDTFMSSPASASCANRTDQKGRKKRKKGRLWTTDANRLQILVSLKKMRHLRRAFQRFLRKFTSKLQVLYARKPCVFPQFVQNSWWCWYCKSQTLQRSCGRSDHVFSFFKASRIFSPQIIQYSIPPFWSVWSFAFHLSMFCCMSSRRTCWSWAPKIPPHLCTLHSYSGLPPNPLPKGTTGKERGKHLPSSLGCVFFKASIIKWHDMAFFFSNHRIS